jgi:hypothetical protein
MHFKTTFPVLINTDNSIDAPPTFKPAKKYSDLSGLLVKLFINYLKPSYHFSLVGELYGSTHSFEIFSS